MRSFRIHLGAGAVVALATITGCQSVWNNLPGMGSTASTPPRKHSDSGLFANNELSMKPISKAQRADLQMTMGRSLEKKEELDQAIKTYEDVVRKDPKRADAHHRMAVVHDKLGHFKESEGCYRQALTREPKNSEILVDQGYSYYLQRRWAECEKSLRAALVVSPEMKRAHNNLGLVLARTDRHDAALWEFSHAGCNEAEGRANLMHALMVDQHWQEAQQQCQLALASQKATPELQQRLEQLQRMIAARCERMPATSAASSEARQTGAQPSIPQYAQSAPPQPAAQAIALPAPAPKIAAPTYSAPMVTQVAAFAPVPAPVRIPAVAEQPSPTVPQGTLTPQPVEAPIEREQPKSTAAAGSFGPLRLVEGSAEPTAAPAPGEFPRPLNEQPSSVRFVNP